MKYQRLRGTQDIVPPTSYIWLEVERVFSQTFDRFAYHAIRTPLLEPTDLFVRAVGEQSDIVSKEMYTFADRGGRSVTLRPENTASVIRAYLENSMQRLGGIQRLYYIGPMFRYDRPQAGRYRQFHQVGAEAIGSDNPAIDAEMIHVVVAAMRDLGFDRIDVRINSVGGMESRKPYRMVLLDAIDGLADEIEPESMERFRSNPLRIFDSKDYGARLKKKLPPISQSLLPEDADHFAQVKELLTATGVEFTEDPFLVRGLDYYTRTVFEFFVGARGAQNAICGGGRYDNLVEQCGGAPTPAIGFSVGLERLIEALPDRQEAETERGNPEYYVASVGSSSAARALNIARTLRRFGSVETDLTGRSRKKQLLVAEKKRARAAVIVDESDETNLTYRDLRQHSETTVADVDLAGFVEACRSEES